MKRRDATPLSAARDRLSRSAVAIYLAATGVALAILLSALVTDKDHQEQELRDRLLMGTELRSESLGRHLAMLTRELGRLGESAAIDPTDGNIVPERELLRITHRNSAVFDVGVAILDDEGKVAWSEPQRFLPQGEPLGVNDWFHDAKRDGRTQIVPVMPDRSDALVYVVSPVIRDGRFIGALLGGIDLATGGSIEPLPGDNVTVLATRQGEVVFPPNPPAFSEEESFVRLARGAGADEGVRQVRLGGVDREVAVSPVADTDFALMSIADSVPFYQPARSRLWVRLAAALGLLLAPLLLLASRLLRELRIFRLSEEEVLRADRIRHLGEASNAIAHEVKNSLNGIRVGLDLLLHRGKGDGAVVDTLRAEIQRLTDFTSDLLLFSRGPVARARPVELGTFVSEITELQREVAAEQGIRLEVEKPAEAVTALADPQHVHVILSNLIGNAIDAVSSRPSPRIDVRLDVRDGVATVAVSDNGPGVDPALVPRLFEPFATGKPSGVGLGLALSRNLAAAQGGGLELAPSPHGATFRFSLPLAHGESAQTPPPGLPATRRHIP
ncbi:PAS domain-containing sensor histidine kinase [Vulgatibacter incomptus]|uniref:histidine kinase n=1 Tax=Vulgatibacter incomptus TaxID=1391653 RepID=A0A0K1P9B1_9BACT|nr:PAS domain-containing sensor histidine kinase [Vulgatibacter incomptus]AKU90123.1 periplasmic sensor signal transduction histidine kinase [Vulgatibacter incomptus]